MLLEVTIVQTLGDTVLGKGVWTLNSVLFFWSGCYLRIVPSPTELDTYEWCTFSDSVIPSIKSLFKKVRKYVNLYINHISKVALIRVVNNLLKKVLVGWNLEQEIFDVNEWKAENVTASEHRAMHVRPRWYLLCVLLHVEGSLWYLKGPGSGTVQAGNGRQKRILGYKMES